MANKNKPERQHFIPRSYLRNFAESINSKNFVDALELKTGKRIYASTKDVCVKSGIYTLPFLGDVKYELEKYYAMFVDGVYPNVYKLLIDKTKTHLTIDEKYNILNTLMCLYFRSPKPLHKVNKHIEEGFDFACQVAGPDEEEIQAEILGTKISFLRSKVEEVKKQHREDARLAFIIKGFSKWHELVQNKFNCNINVYEIEGDVNLITSDNPVVIYNPKHKDVKLFDPQNYFYLPLDRKHYLLVSPCSNDIRQFYITREGVDDFDAKVLNMRIQQEAEKFIIGYPGTLQKHTYEQKKMGEASEENLNYLANVRQALQVYEELFALADKHGPSSHEVVDKVKQIRKMDNFKSNNHLQQIVQNLVQRGYA